MVVTVKYGMAQDVETLSGIEREKFGVLMSSAIPKRLTMPKPVLEQFVAQAQSPLMRRDTARSRGVLCERPVYRHDDGDDGDASSTMAVPSYSVWETAARSRRKVHTKRRDFEAELLELQTAIAAAKPTGAARFDIDACASTAAAHRLQRDVGAALSAVEENRAAITVARRSQKKSQDAERASRHRLASSKEQDETIRPADCEDLATALLAISQGQDEEDDEEEAPSERLERLAHEAVLVRSTLELTCSDVETNLRQCCDTLRAKTGMATTKGLSALATLLGTLHSQSEILELHAAAEGGALDRRKQQRQKKKQQARSGETLKSKMARHSASYAIRRGSLLEKKQDDDGVLAAAQFEIRVLEAAVAGATRRTPTAPSMKLSPLAEALASLLGGKLLPDGNAEDHICEHVKQLLANANQPESPPAATMASEPRKPTRAAAAAADLPPLTSRSAA